MGFRMIYDALTKSKLLQKAYEDIGNMNMECKKIFERSFECLVQNKDKEALELSNEDKKINRYEVDIRNSILGYLAVNTAPDLNAALTLTSVVIDYERIGDYCKIIAHLGVLYPAKLEGNEYMDIINNMKDTIVKQYDLAYMAFKESDIEKAKKVIDSYSGIKALHTAIVYKLNRTKDMEINKAITYASLTVYLRRISAHLKNICTSVVKAFPEIGFEKKDF